VYKDLMCSSNYAFYRGSYEKPKLTPSLCISSQFSVSRQTSVYCFYHQRFVASVKISQKQQVSNLQHPATEDNCTQHNLTEKQTEKQFL